MGQQFIIHGVTVEVGEDWTNRDLEELEIFINGYTLVPSTSAALGGSEPSQVPVSRREREQAGINALARILVELPSSLVKGGNLLADSGELILLYNYLAQALTERPWVSNVLNQADAIASTPEAREQIQTARTAIASVKSLPKGFANPPHVKPSAVPNTRDPGSLVANRPEHEIPLNVPEPHSTVATYPVVGGDELFSALSIDGGVNSAAPIFSLPATMPIQISPAPIPGSEDLSQLSQVELQQRIAEFHAALTAKMSQP